MLCPWRDLDKDIILDTLLETAGSVNTEFLERRELQLLVEATKHPPDSQEGRQLLHLSNRLWQAIAKLEARAADPAPGGIVNPWHEWPDPTEPHGIEIFSKPKRSL